MITSEQSSLLSELRSIPIPAPTLEEFLARLKHRIHSMILDAFKKSGLSQKELAERLDWDEGRISRCLGNSGNYTLKTINALLLAIGVDLDDPTYTSFDALEQKLTAPALRFHDDRKAGTSHIQIELGLVAGRPSGGNRYPITVPPFGNIPHTTPLNGCGKDLPKGESGRLLPFLAQTRALGEMNLILQTTGVANG
jgi:transcriptional regulator with XRE-family HTH domain